jgi:hypothetical protein
MKLNILILSLLVGLYSCTKDPIEEKTITGKWKSKSSYVDGLKVLGDGSYLKFNECSDFCSGEDYEATNQTSGIFIYELSSDQKTIIIDDIMDEGGSWNGTWDVVKLTHNYLEISSNSFLGKITFTFTKE